MKLTLASLLPLPLITTVLAADAYCNTDKTLTGIGGYTLKFPALRAGGSCIMNDGAEGAGVQALQVSLNHCYSAGLSEDGKYGDKTHAAVLKTQKAEKMARADQDGIWGPKTGAKMDWWASKKVAQGTETAFSCVKAII